MHRSHVTSYEYEEICFGLENVQFYGSEVDPSVINIRPPQMPIELNGLDVYLSRPQLRGSIDVMEIYGG